MKALTVLIPFFNEERTIPELVAQLAHLPTGTFAQVIFVDDGSTDTSMVRLRVALEEHQLPHMVLSKENGGKASAIRAGSAELKTSHVVILDSDLELATTDIVKMWAVVQSGDSDFVFGYRNFLAHSSFTWHSGSSVSLSSDGRLLAVGAGFDDYNIGATWIFVSDDGAMYQQLGMKLVGNDADRPWSFQGKTRLVMHAVL